MLTVAITVVLALIGLFSLRNAAPARANDLAQRWWHRMERRLAKTGLEQHTGEGPRDFIARACAARPDLDAPLRKILEAYLRLRYLDAASNTAEPLIAAVRALPRIKGSAD